MSDHRGLTLIELMLAVAIIAILAAVAISGTGAAIRRSQEAVTKGNLGTLRATIATYYTDHDGQYPTDSTLASITSGDGYLSSVPTKYTPPYHPPGNDIDGGDWPDMGNDRRELRPSGPAWRRVVRLLSPRWSLLLGILLGVLIACLLI